MREKPEKIVRLTDARSGLDGFIVLHDTSRGPATGGIRLYPYASEADALEDGLLLARAMTFKAAAADLPVGGGKIVAIQPAPARREDCLRAIGRTIESMNGEFLAGRDVGVPVEDGAIVRGETAYMVDESEEGVGDLNLATALGVLAGARATLSFRLGRSNFSGVRVALQGAGGVGGWLARKLSAEGAALIVADPNAAALERLRADVDFTEVHPDEIYDADCDLFSPCAVGGVLSRKTAPRLKARIVAGSANNVLRQPEAGATLFAAGITYAPDFLVNAGALIQGVRFLLRGERSSPKAIEGIGDKTSALLVRAKDEGVPPEVLLEEETLSRLG